MLADGTYFDGQSAQSQPAQLQLLGDLVEVRVAGRSLTFEKHNSRLVPPVGKGTWIVELGGGATVQFTDDEFGKSVSQAFGGSRFVDMLERSWHWALITLVVAVAGVWGILTFGVPVAAERIAFAVPPDIDQQLGEESIELLDRMMFEESLLEDAEQERVRALFEEIRVDYTDAEYFRIEFRASPTIGANAFAVPGGLVIMTDEMVRLAETDDELISVLAHEIGHLHQRHGLRVLLQNSISAIVIAGLTGDLANITALSATIPTMLMQAKYSRDFEREADEFAFEYMERHGLDTDALSDLLIRLEETAGESGDPLSVWTSSHPRSEDRRPDAD